MWSLSRDFHFLFGSVAGYFQFFHACQEALGILKVHSSNPPGTDVVVAQAGNFEVHGRPPGRA